jgi:hypothetical protein
MKGLSFRVGAFRGESIKAAELKIEGLGNLIVTTRNVFFSAPLKAQKIPAKRIASIEPYSDGIAILRDNANALPMIFKVDDPWFAANVIVNLNQLAH